MSFFGSYRYEEILTRPDQIGPYEKKIKENAHMGRPNWLLEVLCNSSLQLHWTQAPGFKLLTFLTWSFRLMIINIPITIVICIEYQRCLIHHFYFWDLTATAQLSFESLTGLPATQLTLEMMMTMIMRIMMMIMIIMSIHIPANTGHITKPTRWLFSPVKWSRHLNSKFQIPNSKF